MGTNYYLHKADQPEPLHIGKRMGWRMAEVIELDAMRPHYCIGVANGNQHVIPVALVSAVSCGSEPPAVLGDDVLRKIVSEWQAFIGG